ncbi:type I glyceraldehyde-3-phosphate dehydrogenase [Gynurincola endophyticus]|uniref:type I glyceraldehyde-3-phosphate dehydrogenase n=1 Tax=Gynurincola endophyticus TaxID=2479004 RepID=UPI000F8D71D6|nr:glyceraldehyde 3-phosphate dehydrogenase NAD-binding domain-containing protein [Gynurincola endophyticus]
MRVAINGMGRIGRLLFRRLLQESGVQIVAINDVMDPGNLAYLLKYDSVYGTFETPLAYEKGFLTAGEQKVAVFQQNDPLHLPWKDLEVDLVLECSGQFTSKAKASLHLKAGAQKVLLSTTGSNDIDLMIYGFNQHLLTPETQIVSPGGCMTNCSTHLLYLFNSIGIESAQFHVLHSYTSRQLLVDGPHKQFRRGRAAGESIVPVEVDLFQSLEILFPMLKGKISSLSTRIPVANGAMADLTLVLKQPATKEEVNKLLKTAADTEYKGILEYTEEEVVSLDIKGNKHSLVIDGSLTTVIGNQVKVIAWFDNEYGYTSRIIDWLYYWNKQ